MAEDLQVDILTHDEIYGSTSYTLTVRVTNTSQATVDRISVKPLVLSGRLLIPDTAPEQSTVNELEAEKRRLVSELERQVERAYEQHQIRQMNFVESFIHGIKNSEQLVARSSNVSSDTGRLVNFCHRSVTTQ